MNSPNRQQVREAIEALDPETAAQFKDAYYKAIEGLQEMFYLYGQAKKFDENFRGVHGVTMVRAMKPVRDAFNSLDEAVFGEFI